MGDPAASVEYVSRDVTLRIASRSLTVAGAAVDCEPRVFDLVVYLVERRERVADKNELVAALWNGRPASDASLSQLVYKARRSLADDGAARTFIRTVHGRGFRWVAPVSTVESIPAASPAARVPRRAGRRVLGATLATAFALCASLPLLSGVTADRPAARVLVLPVDVAPDVDGLDWAPLGIMGVVANALDDAGDVATVDASVARRFVGRADATPAQRSTWREAAGASHSLSLTLTRAGSLLALEATLDGADGERRRTLFGDDAGRLALDMSGVVRDLVAPRRRGGAAPADLDGEVATTYALGVDAHLRGDLDGAQRYFALCVERRPDALRPRLKLAAIALKHGNAQRAADLVDDVLRRADPLRDAPHVVAAQRQLGYVELQRGRLDAAQAAFERALDGPAAAAQRAETLDGLSQVASRRARYDDAAAHLRESLALMQGRGDAIGTTVAWHNLGILERMRGRGADARDALLRALEVARAGDVRWQQSATLASLVQLAVAQGRYREALTLGEPALAQLQPPAPRDAFAERVLLVELATARTALGQVDAGLAYATRALALADSVGDATLRAMANVVLAQAGAARGEPHALAAYAQAVDDCAATGQLPRAAFHASALARLQRLAGDAAGLARTADRVRALAADAQASGVRAHAVATQAQVDAAAGRADEALQRLADAYRDALAARDEIGARRLALERAQLGVEFGRLDAARAALDALDATQTLDSDASAVAAAWLRARGDTARAAALRERDATLDAALPPANAAVLASAR